MKTAVIVFSSHLKLQSLSIILEDIKDCHKIVFVTPQYVFDNERFEIKHVLNADADYVCFADLMTDKEGEECDYQAFIPYLESGRLSLSNMYSYFDDLSILKNELLVAKVNNLFKPNIKIVLSNDLGICIDIWQRNGYKRVDGDYYYSREYTAHLPVYKKLFVKGSLKKIINKFKEIPKILGVNYPKNVYVAYYKEKKILFHGHLARAGYRINLDFKEDKLEAFKHWIVKLLYVVLRIKIDRRDVVNLTTLHEYGNYAYYEMMDIPEFHNYLLQDGYLPPNDTCKYLFFYGKHSNFLTWDKLGKMVFDYHRIPSQILPCRNIFPLPEPNFRSIKKVLCVSSGAGDWTAIKNRSDEDKTVVAFVEMAKRYPSIEFVYRCHPSWVSPSNQGVNSIQRVAEYFDWLKLPNIKVSTNIPSFFDSKGNVIVSHKRSSLESDLNDADIVFGVHSISMIDGAMKGIPFASVNLSGRRNLWKGITDLGFPHCEDIESISKIIDSICTSDFKTNYLKSVENYNKIIHEKK